MARTSTVKQTGITRTLKTKANSTNPISCGTSTIKVGAEKDVSTMVSGAQGTVTYTIKSQTTSGSSMSGSTLTAGVLSTSNDNDGTVVVKASAAGNGNYE